MKNDWAAVKIIGAKRRRVRVLFCCFSLEQVKSTSCRFLCCSEEPVFMVKEEKMGKDVHYIVRSSLLHFSTASC